MTTMRVIVTTRVGIRELKAKLSHYLERAAAGETIVVTDRGKARAGRPPRFVEAPTQPGPRPTLQWMRGRASNGPAGGTRSSRFGAISPVCWREMRSIALGGGLL